MHSLQRCHVSHYCVLDNLLMISVSRSSETGIGCIWMETETPDLKKNMFDEIRAYVFALLNCFER